MKILWFGRSALEKVLEKETRKRDKEELMSVLKGIIVFPGSKEEFEDFIKYKTEWVDLGWTDKGLICTDADDDLFSVYNLEYKKKIIEAKVVALVNVQRYTSASHYNRQYGMPVKKKYK